MKTFKIENILTTVFHKYLVLVNVFSTNFIAQISEQIKTKFAVIKLIDY